MNQRALVVLLLCTLFFFSNCNSTSNDCNQVMCTMQFVYISVKLTDASGSLFKADRVETYDKNGRLLYSETEPYSNIDTGYMVLSDNQLKLLKRNQDNQLKFKVFKNSRVIKEAEYIVTADCCHIGKKSGADILVID